MTHQTSAERKFAAAHARILIVDADPGARAALSDAVIGLGHTVCHTAEPGPSAIDLPPASPDLALVGLEPDETAEVVLETAARIAEELSVPIVYATETTDAALLDRAQATNPHGYVLRSAGPQQLDLTIRAALGAVGREQADRERHGREVADLKTQLRFFQRVFDHMSDPIVVVDHQGNFEAINSASKQILATYNAPTVEKWFEHFVTYYPDGQTPFAMEDLPLMRALRGETTKDTLLVLRSHTPEANPEELWFRVTGYPLLDSDGQCVGGAVVLRDASAEVKLEAKRKNIEAELHERLQVLDTVVRCMTDGVVVADAQAQPTLFNPSAERIVGIGKTDRPPDEWTDTYGIFFLDGTTPVPTDELPLVRAVRGETIEELELFIRNSRIPQGTHISVNASPLRDESQQVIGGVAVFRDISERRMQEDALIQAFAHGRLEIIDTVLHNIGNAINSVATGADTLYDWFAEGKLVSRFEALGNIINEHERDWTSWLEHDAQGQQVRPFLLSLIQDLTNNHTSLKKTTERVRDRVRHITDIIRTQGTFTNGTVERKRVDLKRTMTEAAKVIQKSVGHRGGTIKIDCTQAPAEIMVQENRFQQMLVNLLKNAMEATDECAEQRTNDPSWRPSIRVLAYSAEPENFLTIDVIDNGIGIDPTRFRSVFSAGYTTKKRGTGLGLHSAANFVIGSGGTIQPISDGIGQGTTMRVLLRNVAVRDDRRGDNE